MENVMAFYVILYMILGLVIYHSIFEIWYFNFGKALLGELVGALFFGGIMTALTLKFWWLALIIIILIGLALSAKVKSPVGKKIVIGTFVVIAIITAISGISYNKQKKEEEREEARLEEEASREASREEESRQKEEAQYHTPVDPGMYIKEVRDSWESIEEGTTYICNETDGFKFFNAQYDDETRGVMRIQFTVFEDEHYGTTERLYIENNADKPLIYIWADDNGIEIQDEGHVLVIGDEWKEEGFNGLYTLATDEDAKNFEKIIMQSREADNGEYANNTNNMDIPYISDAYVIATTASSALSETGYDHSAKLIHDSDTNTAWVEGDESGNGEGESITIYFDGTYWVNGFMIYAGYQKSDGAYSNNSRPQILRVSGDDGYAEDIVLDDVCKGQKIILNAPLPTSQITLEIISAYGGEKYTDTCISEIVFDGMQ